MRVLKRLVSFPFIISAVNRKKKNDAIKQITRGGVWFIDIPRTGSTTIKTQLSNVLGNEFGKRHVRENKLKNKKFMNDHMPAIEVRRLIGTENWKSLYTFSIVRNPWKRFFSLYKYRKVYGDIPKDLSFDHYLHLLERNNTRHLASPYNYNFYYMPMCDFIMDSSNQILVDEVFKFEQMDKVSEMMLQKFNIDLSNQKSYEVTGTQSEYKTAYTKKGIDIISKIYADDIQYFNYSFES